MRSTAVLIIARGGGGTSEDKFFCRSEPSRHGGQRPFLASTPTTFTGASQLPVEVSVIAA